MTGAADYSWSGTIADAGAGVTSERILSNGSFTVNHDDNGNASSAVYYWFNGSYTGAIASPAAPNGVAITLPKIDRTAGTPTISNVSSTYNSASCNITVPFASTVNQYSRDGSNWSNWNRSVSANSAFSDSWSGLSPNTTYTFYYRFRRDYNQVWSSAVSFTVTTKKPATGNANNISISVSSTYNSATINLSGGSPGAGGSVRYYRINFNGGGWKQVSNPATFTDDIIPNRTYRFYVGFVDSDGHIARGNIVHSVTTKSSSPLPPTKGTVSVSNITYNGAKLSWSGFSFGSGATWGKYQYSWDNSNWTDCGQSTNLIFTDKSPNTSYNFYVRLVDNYGQASGSATVSFTTKKPAAPTRGTVSVSSKTYNSITYSWSGFSFGEGGTWGKYQYSYDNNSWVDIGQNTSHTRSSLSPNTNYTLYIRLVDKYDQASAVAFVTGTTDKSAAPSKGTVTVANITESSATFMWSGFRFVDGGNWGYYRYSLDGSNWTKTKNFSDVGVTLTGLSANTSYTFYVQLVDNYGQASATAYVTFKTKAIKDWKYGVVYIKVNDKWKYGIVYYKVDDIWRTVTGTYFKGQIPTVALVDSNGSILTDSNGIVLNAIQ